MLVKNCHHHSKKDRKGRGVSKGVIRARKQSLKALLRKIERG
jgi:hypothetical protein